MTVIPIVISALGTLPIELMKGLKDLEIEVQEENIQTTALLRSARILRRVLETWGDLLSLKHLQLALVWKTLKESHDNNLFEDLHMKT